MGFLETLIVLALLIAVFNLRGRVIELEKKIKERPVVPAASASASTAMPASQVQAATAQGVQAQPVPTAAPAPAGDGRFIEWMKENWLLKLGAMLLLIGFGWLATYAFLNNWIGPAGRISLGLGLGALILALGWWRMRAYVAQGSVFVVLGATVILLTTYAARSFYDFFTPASALGLMFVTSVFVALASGVYNRKQLAIASVALAGLAPILAHSPTSDYIGLFWYLLIVVLGAVWIVIWKGYREVTTTALVLVALYSLPVLVGLESADRATLLLFAYAFGAVFYITNTAGLLRLKGSDAVPDLVTAAGNAIFLLAWIYLAAPTEFQSLIMAAWAAAFVVGAFLVFRVSGQRESLYLYAAIGVGYIAAATAVELDGAVLTIAYTLEAAAVAAVLFGITRDVAAAQRSMLLLIGPAMLSIPSILSSEWQVALLNQHFFVLLILTLTLFGLGGAFWKSAHLSGSQEVISANNAILIAGSGYAFIMIWLSLHSILPQNPDMAVMISLIIYTVVGIWAYIEGATHSRKGLRVYGGTLLVFVVARLLIVDVWQMEITGRIITFFLVGALLMSTAFLGRVRKQPAVVPEHNV
ncbi:hypothetical protein A3D71_03595 [Candidatus Kaiserbacteria bacterium RIFCSPHIGHO2_02_FULL_55_20]|uniref:DUF2339 domain-containing protein n=1 Tax=Candidatus Kaiserbacteria bacterium RIFCSPHIGHO2_02_FULL_55_20 TaxID=1798497 RepID=A0A1F6DV62_9BACT|nr:MAG: hypothetical protein A2680_04410 [Candidatus Kaiserbacteria bacterium RIFCSPHIGHO2_01_FULL_55_37]OGG65298.1 MAG: hypothetical protein A3D71_03595 [Candidatus Kaiserbacteria bacterium RIFCSPHIGHO2_02_FULL_55_20]